MLDINSLRKDLASVVARLETRKKPQQFLDVAAFTALEAERKTIQTRTEELQAQRNQLSKQIGQLKSKGENADAAMAQVAQLKAELEQSAARLDAIQPEMEALLLALPNLPHPDFIHQSPSKSKYADSIVEVDSRIGAIMDKVRELGLEEDTFVFCVFCFNR